MRIVVTSIQSDDYTYEGLEIVIDDTYKFAVSHSDDTPEDNNLSRNFADCYDIPNMLKKAYEAGLKKEEFKIEYNEDVED